MQSLNSNNYKLLYSVKSFQMKEEQLIYERIWFGLPTVKEKHEQQKWRKKLISFVQS